MLFQSSQIPLALYVTISQNSRETSGTTSQNTSLKPLPIPITIVTGKNSTARKHNNPSCSPIISKLKANIPANIETINITIITKRSLVHQISIIIRNNKMNSSSLRGNLMMAAQVAPHASSKQLQSQSQSSSPPPP